MKNALFVILQIVVLAEQLQWTKSEKKYDLLWAERFSKQIGTLFLIMNLLSDNSHIEFAVLQP